MKKLFSYLTLLMCAMVFTACVKQYNQPPQTTTTVSFGRNPLVYDSSVNPQSKKLFASFQVKNNGSDLALLNFTVGFNLAGGMQLANVHNYFLGVRGNAFTVALEPKIVNLPSADFPLPPGEFINIDVVFDIDTATAGSVTPTLTAIARVGQVGIKVNDLASATIIGQTFKIKTPPPPPAPLAVPAPTFVSATSSTAGMVAVGTLNGAKDATKMSFNVILPAGSVSMKTVWKSKSSNSGQPVSFVKIGNVIAPFVGDSAVVTIPVTASTTSTTGTDFTALVSYFPINQSIVSGTQSTMTLSSVTVATSTQSASVASNMVFPMQTLVGSYPTYTINTTPITGFVPGATEYKFAELIVTANAMGDVSLAQLKFLITSTGFTSAGVTFANTRITNVAGITINQSNGSVHNVTGTDYVLYTLPTDMLIKAGTSVTLYLMAPISGTSTSTSYAVYSTMDATGTLFMDVAGGNIVWPCTSPYGPLTTAKATLSN